jgi:hypothetical protein
VAYPATFIVTLRSMDLPHPMLMPGIKFNMNRNKDAYFMEGQSFS